MKPGHRVAHPPTRETSRPRAPLSLVRCSTHEALVSLSPEELDGIVPFSIPPQHRDSSSTFMYTLKYPKQHAHSTPPQKTPSRTTNARLLYDETRLDLANMQLQPGRVTRTFARTCNNSTVSGGKVACSKHDKSRHVLEIARSSLGYRFYYSRSFAGLSGRGAGA
ncbi:hypothetical protein BDY17DRAFT_14413 [Neohortaea acidophila]|uniref:Uncharacterized protein n=1 Tax=Neohortaea acidophila TaxID=245834 RepID=A0A6A6Q6I2_9PEZI|nr:uncharacterized protein BDY17DRAFT_14413 [Neohortaea acidophila]KAF2487594.1 hypothetical protein BDY17DRAFT_14413 [Neohortaea acidophila]